MPDPLRIVIAEDNYLVREGIRRVLEATSAVDVLAAVSTAPELEAAVSRLAPDAVLVDIRMPPGHRMEGIEAAHAIRAKYPNVGVVILSQHADEAYAFELLRYGTAGLAYLLKDRVADPDELVRALNEVSAGRSVVDSEVVEALVAHRARQASSPIAELTPRELDILSAIAEGLTNAAIGKALHLSTSAIEKYATSIFSKLGLADEVDTHRRVAAVLKFLEQAPTVREA